MSYEKRKTLFIFLDESGNLDFSHSGTKFWSLTACCTFNPVPGREALLDLLYTLADSGEGQECFHATTDKQEVRDRVFAIIRDLKDDLEIHTVVAEKRKAHPSLYRKWAVRKGKKVLVKDESKFYNLIGRTLLQYIFKNPKYAHAERIVVVLSYIFDKSKHSAIEGTLKTYLKQKTNIPFVIYFHQNKADLNCQLADYCGWAITIKWERKEERSFKLVAHKVKSEFPIFIAGHTNHLTSQYDATARFIPMGRTRGFLLVTGNVYKAMQRIN